MLSGAFPEQFTQDPQRGSTRIILTEIQKTLVVGISFSWVFDYGPNLRSNCIGIR